MGAGEGGLLVPAVAGSILFEADAQRARPAYTEASLARALRVGVDPAGRALSPLMPRYPLQDGEAAALTGYLRTLSAQPSPGVDGQRIQFATVFGDDVLADQRQAVLDVLQTYVDEKNRETRRERLRPEHGLPSGQRRPRSYRTWELRVWDLVGPSSGWREQLEARYAEQPVFAVLGGTSSRPWSVVHRFCEDHELPCLLPSVVLPAAREADFYTVYFSRGLLLEADLIARDAVTASIARLVQVFRKNSTGAEAAAALRQRLREDGPAVEDLELGPDEAPSFPALARRLRETPGSAAVLWLTWRELDGIAALQDSGAARLYLSATLGDGEFSSLPWIRVPAFAAHPFRLASETDPGLQRFRLWLRSRRIPPRHARLQAEAFFACLAANEALMHMGRHFFRDYLLDRLDHAQGLGAYLPLYPSPSTGPGQRFLSKGGYVVPLTSGNEPDQAGAVWIVP